MGSEPVGRTTHEEPALVDARGEARKRTVLKGKLSYSFGTFSADCTIRNKSESGAKVKVEKGLLVPDWVMLVDLLNRVAYNAKVMWRRADGNMGLKFFETHDLTNPTTDELKLMKLYCVEHGGPGRRVRSG